MAVMLVWDTMLRRLAFNILSSASLKRDGVRQKELGRRVVDRTRMGRSSPVLSRATREAARNAPPRPSRVYLKAPGVARPAIFSGSKGSLRSLVHLALRATWDSFAL